MRIRMYAHTSLICAAAVVAAAMLTQAGPPNPPAGPIAPTNKTLWEMEPRTVVNAVNTPSESDSLFTISQPGSYYLVNDIIGVAGKHGVKIVASGVTLDLNGFSLLGVANSLDGVHVSAPGARNIVVRNGSVVGWWENGVDISAATKSSILDLRAESNAMAGLRVGDRNMVANCSASGNFESGVVAGDQCSILQTSATGNAVNGVQTGAACQIDSCVAQGNARVGVAMGAGNLVTRSRAHQNGSALSETTNGGFLTSGSCTIVDSAATNNTGAGISVGDRSLVASNTASGNSFAGVIAGANSMIVDNMCADNVSPNGSAAGISIRGATGPGHSRIEGNTANGNDVGIHVFSSGNFIARNTASGNTANNYDIVANNKVGPVVSVPDSTAFHGSTGGAGVGTTDPWANLSF